MRTDHTHPNRGWVQSLAFRAPDRRPCTKTSHASRVRSLLCGPRLGVSFPVPIPGIEITHLGGPAGVDRPRPEHCTKASGDSAAVGSSSICSDRGGVQSFALRAPDRRPCTKTSHASRVRSLLCESRYRWSFPVPIPGIEITTGSGFAGVDRPRPEHCAKAICDPATVAFSPDGRYG